MSTSRRRRSASILMHIQWLRVARREAQGVAFARSLVFSDGVIVKASGAPVLMRQRSGGGRICAACSSAGAGAVRCRAIGGSTNASDMAVSADASELCGSKRGAKGSACAGASRVRSIRELCTRADVIDRKRKERAGKELLGGAACRGFVRMLTLGQVRTEDARVREKAQGDKQKKAPAKNRSWLAEELPHGYPRALRGACSPAGQASAPTAVPTGR
jgi:hypothetical protein